MIQLKITQTAKGYHPSAEWQGMGESTKDFPDMKSALAYLEEQYGSCYRSKMFIDQENGMSLHCGWIYSFRNSDLSHLPVERWLQHDWVTFYRVEPIDLGGTPN